MTTSIDSPPIFPRTQAKKLVQMALDMDVGTGDITTRLTIPENPHSTAKIVAKQDGVFCGRGFLDLVFPLLGEVKCQDRVDEGQHLKAGDVVVNLEGPVRLLLQGERVLLNFLQRMCGVASLTATYVKALEGTKTNILDTRKTLPAYRLLDKYAVRVGGGTNHRMGLHDMVLVKENHIMGAGGIRPALDRIFAGKPKDMKVEVEIEKLSQLDVVLLYDVDWVMLDNMNLDQLREAVQRIRAANRGIRIEASGNMDLERVRSVAECGVDAISVGGLTHSTPAMDLSMRFD